MDIQFVGEHLRPGQLGHFFVITSLVAALFSTFSYFRAVQTEHSDPYNSKAWQILGRSGFGIHTAAIVGIFAVLYYIITGHLFEYHYAWGHSSRDMPSKYLLSCFWEGQQGSFMLWTFWHCVLGLIVMNTAKNLETRTMAIIAMVQVFLCTMILGIYLGNSIQIGTTPFQLLRNVMRNAPIFSMPNYMDFVKDGNGLNVLLQNYWMVIHPPILFLGFALTLIPFAYCIAAMWKGEYEGFVKPTVIWSLAGGAVLGTGIMMGGAWAYESLNFGGYWAWDPVENASLVPWLTLIAGLHTLLVYRSTRRALTATFILLIISHLLVWYSTFLTRTGILGKTSVHAFTGDGTALTYHLLGVIGILLVLSVTLLVVRWKRIPTIKSEEPLWSREFWMFVGSIVLFLSAIQITITTSTPVWSPLAKWISGKDFAPPVDIMQHYNNIQVWVAIIIGLLSGTVLYMKYKADGNKKMAMRLLVTAVIAAIPAVLIGMGQHISAWQYSVMLYSSCFAIVASIHYGIVVQKGRVRQLGPVVSHLGFATVLLGILLSSYNKHAISFNTTGENFNFQKKTEAETHKENMENVLLFRGVPVAMGEYFATYVGDSEVGGKDRRIYYIVNFERRDKTGNQVLERFTLYPDAFINPKGEQGMSANPSTKHYADKDIFTFINSATDKSKTDKSEYESHVVNTKGDTIHLKNSYMVYEGLSREINDKRYVAQDSDLAISARLSVYDSGSKKTAVINPIYILRNKQYVAYMEDTLRDMGIYARLDNIMIKSQDSVSMDIKIKQTDMKDDFIVLKALVFPYINVLWLGVVIMVFGFFISIGNMAMRGKKAIAIAE